jgi:hypothetical protein
MAKKMCEHWIPGKGQPEVCPIIKGRGKDKGDFVCAGYYKCGKGCEIITRKPKMVKVKGWAWMDRAGKKVAAATTTYKNMEYLGVYDGFPCTILIDRKYLKGGK